MAVMTAPAPTVPELQQQLDAAETILEDALARLQRARHAAVSGDPAALAEEQAAEISATEAERHLRRYQSAVEEQQRLDVTTGVADRNRKLTLTEDEFLEYLDRAETAAEKLQKHLAGYADAYAAYLAAAAEVHRMLPALGDRVRTDFSLQKGEYLAADELARVSHGARGRPPGAAHHTGLLADVTQLEPLVDRVRSLTGCWRANVADARAART